VEVPGMTGPVTRPGHLGHGRSVSRAVHSRGIGLEETPERPEVEGPPVASAFALVVARGAHSAPPAPALGGPSRTHVDHHCVGLLVEVHILDHRGPVDTEHATPYVGTEHRHPPRFVLWTFKQSEN